MPDSLKTHRKNQYIGCLLGLALGDAFGAPYEGGPIERLLWRLIGKTHDGKNRWTDDTQMALNVAESLLENDGLDQDLLARRFAQSYRWSRGYGPAAAKLLRRIARGRDWREVNRAAYPEGSFGNGAAMRAPVIGLFYATRPDELKSAAHRSAEITHAHPLALDGAALVSGDAIHRTVPLASRFAHGYHRSKRYGLVCAILSQHDRLDKLLQEPHQPFLCLNTITVRNWGAPRSRRVVLRRFNGGLFVIVVGIIFTCGTE